MTKFSSKTNNLVLHLNGGMGKMIMATAVIASYKRQYPDAKIVIVSGYPEVFVNNPYVYKNFPFATPYLWQDYYGNPDYKVLAADPYFEESWIKNEPKHLIDVWCKMLGVDAVQKTPLLYFSGPELDELNAMIKVDKPLLVVQSTGGSNAALRSWSRNPPLSEFNEHLLQYMETHFVLHLAVPETPLLSNVHQRVDNLNRRQAMALIYFATAFVGIDSFGQHARASNPDAGPTVIFFLLAESIDRLGYQKKNWFNVAPVQEVQDLLKSHQDYYATVFKFNIENDSSNCPIPAGVKWFNFTLDPEKA